MHRLRKLASCAILIVVTIAPLSGLTIKIGSLAPVGSPWDDVLRELTAEWQRLSGGSVKAIVYGGGTAGDEPAMLRKMRIGHIDGAAITVTGLTHVYPGVMTIQTPLLITDDAELDYVLDKVRPYYEEQIEEKGFKVLFWTLVGWAYLFSTEPVVTPDDLRALKYYVLEGDAEFIKTWKDLGFRPVPLATTDVLAGLQSGMVEAYAATILSSLSLQWFGVAKHMTDMTMAPMLAVLVISMRTWNRIPADLRSEYESVARGLEERMRAETSRLDQEALAIMNTYGLVTHPVPEQVVGDWREVLREGFLKTTDMQAYELVAGYVEEFRNR